MYGIVRSLLLGTLVGILVCTTHAATPQAPAISDSASRDRTLRHATPEWQAIADHLPDLATGNAANLELAADVLRARRYPEDALDFYAAAMAHGGPELRLRNRIGITELGLYHIELARIHLKRALQLDRNFAEGWNNLGAVEYVAGNYRAALADYQRAVKLNATAAVYHSNMGTAYFELGDYPSARKQFGEASRLDPYIFDRMDGTGIQAHVMSPHDRGRFCMEMAELAASHEDDAGVMRWLSLASSTEDDLLAAMGEDAHLRPYRKDARVLLLVANAKTLHTRQMAKSAPAPMLPEPVSAQTPQR